MLQNMATTIMKMAVVAARAMATRVMMGTQTGLKETTVISTIYLNHLPNVETCFYCP